MLKPKQIVPLYNGARAWFVAGTYKGSSLEDGSGSSESPDVERSRDSSNGFVSRASINITKETVFNNSRNNFSGKSPEHAKSLTTQSTKPFCSAATSLTGDFTYKASAVHASVADGIIEDSVSPKLVTPSYKRSVKSGAPSGRSEKHVSSAGVKLSTGTSEKVVEEEDLFFTDRVRKVGFAAAGRISDFQDSIGKCDGTSYMVHRSSRPCSQNAHKQKARADIVRKAVYSSDQEVSGSSTRMGPKTADTLKHGRRFSTCSSSQEVEGQLPAPLGLLNESLSRMKLSTQTVAEPRTSEGRNLVGSRNVAVDQHLFIAPYSSSLSNNIESSDWQIKAECPSVPRGPWRHGDTRREAQDSAQRVNRQGRAGQLGSHNDGKEVVERVCNILGQAALGGDIELALSKLERPLTPYHVNEVLKRQKDVGLALEFFKWAKRQEGYRHDGHTFTTMLGILGRARKFDAVARLLDDMVRDGCKPNVVTFNRLIHCYGTARQMSEALQIFHHMQRVGCVPDKVTYCTLIDLHAKAGFFEVAMDMYRQMQRAGLQPDTFTYSVMINCLGKAGELSAAQKILNEMIGKGCIPNLVTYNILIDLHAKSGKYDMALKLYNDMQETGFRPDQVTYSIVMEVLGHAGHLEQAEHVFTEMQEAGWAPDTTVYGLLVDMWGKTGNLGKACQWYNKMLDSGVTPNVPTCNSLLGAFLRENLYDMGELVLQDMKNQNLVPSLQTYTLLLSCYTLSTRKEDGEKLWSIMATLRHPAHTFLCSLPPARFGPAHTWDCTSRFFDSICREDQESKRSFTDATVSFLHKFNMKAEAAIVWEIAAERKIYPKAVTRKAANYWAINLHTMSMGTAIIALSRTLSNLKEGMLTTGIIPERIDIITGWGRRSRVTGSSLVKQAVEEILKAVSSPFRLENGNLGCFVGIGQPLADWLYESDMEQLYLI
ncbi:hypothetical protein GOP47_0004571 [Adiantum capillus-veneris]|uniref:Smr domain-containing protein n=1 Tax=Adiantum capillus-veneris TaxID=13818 RepID=A0A9D4V849_ADICA|nr:hypothetical protein GOP47_0004571 [Adiantum capillus-veneris]